MINSDVFNKKENTVLSQSLMSLLSILIFAIGTALVVGILLILYTKIIGINTKITVEELIKNDVLIPDYFSDVVSYSVCRIVLGGISIPVLFFLAIHDRFKGSYMNLVDLKKYKFILAIYVVVYTLTMGGFYYFYFNKAVHEFNRNNEIIQEAKADEKGYYNDGIKKIEILPTVTIVTYAISGAIAIYVTLATAEVSNRRYLEAMMSSQTYEVVYTQAPAQSPPQQVVQQNNNSEDNNVFY